jgi:dienelactone hydrolase
MGWTKRSFSKGWLMGMSRFALAAVAVSSMLATPAAASSSPAGPGELHLVVTPAVSLFTEPLRIRVSGLRAGQQVSLSVSSVDSSGFRWTSLSTYSAGPSGTLSPASSPSGGPSYTGVDGMGPVDFMRSSSNYYYAWVNKPLGFHFEAKSGAETASATIERNFGAPTTETDETLDRQGFVGEYFAPMTTSVKKDAAVLIFRGSGGRMSETLLANTLAARGYPALDIAYFDEPGLPRSLEDIPLGYFAKALRWLASRPGVDSHRLWVDGLSRGSEAALLLGVHYPSLVHGVVALVPSDAALCPYPECSGPAWTYQGKPVPYTSEPDNPHPTDDPAAVIAVARIKGPVFLDCGGSDQVWSSCPYAEAIMAELGAAHDPYPHVLMASPQGGHGSALEVPPCEPGVAGSSTCSFVGSWIAAGHPEIFGRSRKLCPALTARSRPSTDRQTAPR